MITQRIDPLDFISIVPPRIAQVEPGLSLDQLRDRFARNDGLPFADVLTEARIRDALDEHGVRYRDRVFDPVTTLWGFLSLATGACHDLAIASYTGKGTGETTLLRAMYDALKPGDVIVADALFDNYFLACELRERGIELVARVQAERVGSRTVESRPDGEIIVWQRPNKARGMTGEQYRRYPESLTLRQVSVAAHARTNRVDRFEASKPIS